MKAERARRPSILFLSQRDLPPRRYHALTSSFPCIAQMPARPNTKFRRAISPAPIPPSRCTRSQLLTFQAQSFLLAKIPPEIRKMIWEATIGGQVVHIVRKKKKKLRHKIRRLPSFIWDWKESDQYGKDDVVGEWSMVSLLRTSRQV